MMPDNELSSSAVVAGFSFPVKTLNPEDKLQDWELGGVALNDASQGLQVKLWHFTLEIDKETDIGSVYVEAPFVPKTLMFADDEISEISGCFDQNMNPFVAYIQAGQPKIWWYDTLAVAQVHTDLPSGAKDLRCSLDDKRDQAVGDSDIFLSYIRGSNLIVCYQRDRYGIEYVLAPTVQRLVSMAMNNGFRMQWRAFGANANGYSDPYLGDIVYDLCRQSGIAPENIDVSELYLPTDTVPGLKIAVDEGFDKPIEWLREIYQFDKSQHGKKLHFLHRGREKTFRIPYDHLVVNGTKQTLSQEIVDGKQLPKKVNVNHIDSTGGFAKNKQTATRRSNLILNKEELTIDSMVVLTPDQAATAALIIIKSKYGEQYEYEFTTTIRYSELTPGDCGEVEDAKGNWHEIRLEHKDEDSHNIEWKARQDAGEMTYGNSNGTGQMLDPQVPTTPGLVGDTLLDIINFPVQQDQYDELSLYIAARGTGSGWSGYALYFSVDGGISYNQAFISEQASNIGETATSITDIGTAVEVLMPYPIESVTSGQIAAGYNRFCMGDEEVQVQTATLLGMVDGKYHYAVSAMTRGVLHTVAEAWPAGTRFIAMDDSVTYVQIQREYYGLDLYYKAVSLGQSLDDVTPLAYLFDHALSQTEWPVTDVEVVAASGGGITVTWNGSPRLGTFGANPFHSKYMIGYQVKFSDGHIIETTAETVTYPAGLMGTVVEVRARNAITGLGPLADGEGAVDPGDIPGFLFSGSFTDGYVGEPIEQINGEGFSASGGFWDANVRGFVVPGVGTKTIDQTSLEGMRTCGIPHEAGTFTSKVRLDASSPDPTKTGTQDVNQSVTIYPRRAYGALDLRFKQHRYAAKLVPTSPPLKQFEINGAASFFFYGVTSGQVIGQFRVTGSTNSFILGISNNKGALSIYDYTIAVGPFDTASYYLGTDATYSIELDADTGNFWIYEDVGSGPVEVHSGNLPLTGSNQYRICLTTEYVQAGMVVEANGGNETWYTAPTQVGFGGIPVPNTPIPLAWGYVFPDYAVSFNGNGVVGAHYADDFTGTPVIKSNAEYSTGKHRWQMHGGFRNGICVAAFDNTSGQLGDPSTPDSVGVGRSLVTAGSYTIHRCFGGVYTASEVVVPAPYSYPQTIFALDADGDTLKICAMDATGTNVLVLDTINLPSGQSWRAAASGGAINCDIKFDPPGPAGYSNAVVP